MDIQLLKEIEKIKERFKNIKSEVIYNISGESINLLLAYVKELEGAKEYLNLIMLRMISEWKEGGRI